MTDQKKPSPTFKILAFSDLPREQQSHILDEPNRTSLVAISLEDWTALRADLASLNTELRFSREDLRRSLAYAQELEEEADRLADEANQTRAQGAELRKELQEERGRRLELEEQFQYLLKELEDAATSRARYHLERARRDEAEEEVETLRITLEDRKKELTLLTEAFERLKKERLRARLGGFTLEIRRSSGNTPEETG